MKVKVIENKYIIRLDKGEDVIKTLKEICKEYNISLGNITGIGATDKVTLGLFNTTNKKYYSKTLEGLFEITSMVGNVTSMDTEVYLHLHCNVSDSDLKVYGGHLNYCRISATCEIIIDSIPSNLDRYFDEEIGLNLLNI